MHKIFINIFFLTLVSSHIGFLNFGTKANEVSDEDEYIEVSDGQRILTVRNNDSRIINETTKINESTETTQTKDVNDSRILKVKHAINETTKPKIAQTKGADIPLFADFDSLHGNTGCGVHRDCMSCKKLEKNSCYWDPDVGCFQLPRGMSKSSTCTGVIEVGEIKGECKQYLDCPHCTMQSGCVFYKGKCRYSVGPQCRNDYKNCVNAPEDCPAPLRTYSSTIPIHVKKQIRDDPYFDKSSYNSLLHGIDFPGVSHYDDPLIGHHYLVGRRPFVGRHYDDIPRVSRHYDDIPLVGRPYAGGQFDNHFDTSLDFGHNVFDIDSSPNSGHHVFDRDSSPDSGYHVFNRDSSPDFGHHGFNSDFSPNLGHHPIIPTDVRDDVSLRNRHDMNLHHDVDVFSHDIVRPSLPSKDRTLSQSFLRLNERHAPGPSLVHYHQFPVSSLIDSNQYPSQIISYQTPPRHYSPYPSRIYSPQTYHKYTPIHIY